VSELEQRYRQVLAEIARACSISGRDIGSVTLVAVSKTYSVENIQCLYDLGHRDFGESRLQEAEPKITALPKDINWHMIGNLQSNKAKRVAQLFEVIHTLSTDGQLREIEKSEKLIDGFIEVNIGEEPQKSGLYTKSLDEYHQHALNSKQVNFLGLMTIGPLVESPELMRPHFRRLKTLNEELGGTCLSMGMSGDFSVAIQEGATHVRVGSAIFGSR